MRILLSGYVMGEGRMSMVLFGRTLRAYLEPLVSPGDSVVLDEPSSGGVVAPLTHQTLWTKLEKRLMLPLRLRRARFDVLHMVDSDYAAAAPDSRIEQTVVTCHDLMPFLHREYGRGDVFGKLGRHFFEHSMSKLARCACVAADSAFTRACVLKYTDCPPDRVKVVHLGIDPGRFNPMIGDNPALEAFRQRHGVPNKEIILHVGAGAWYKNVEAVLQVTRQLIDQGHSNLALLKVGRMTPDQHAMARTLGIEQHLVILPRLEDDEIPLAYHAAGLLLWPSLFEGFGLCALEAMACGIPVVCSNGGSLAEIAGAGAALHDPEDIKGLTASCRRVLEEPAYRQSLVAAGLARAAAFRWEQTAQQYLHVYRAVLAG